MTETARPDILLACEEVRKAAARWGGLRPRTRYWSVLRDWESVRPRQENPLLLVSTVTGVDRDFAERARAIRDRKTAFLLICRDLCKAVPERLAWLDVRDPERIHVAQTDNGGGIEGVLRRFFSTMDHEDQAERVFDAWWEKDTLVVLSPRFRRLHAPLGKIRPLRGKARSAREAFEIDEDGDWIYWPSLDVHLGWEQFAQIADDREYLKARQESGEFNRRYGVAIRALREKAGLRQSDVKGLTPRQIGRIERGRCRATHSALSKLAAAQRLLLSDYLAALAGQQ